MRTLSKREQNRFSASTKNAINRLLYNPSKYLGLEGSLSEEEFAQQVRMEIINLNNLSKKFGFDFWEFARTCEHSGGYVNLRGLFDKGRMMNSCEFIVDGEWCEAA